MHAATVAATPAATTTELVLVIQPGVGDWFAPPWWTGEGGDLGSRDVPLLQAAFYTNTEYPYTVSFDHTTFLDACHASGLYVMLGIAIEGGNCFNFAESTVSSAYQNFYQTDNEGKVTMQDGSEVYPAYPFTHDGGQEPDWPEESCGLYGIGIAYNRPPFVPSPTEPDILNPRTPYVQALRAAYETIGAAYAAAQAPSGSQGADDAR